MKSASVEMVEEARGGQQSEVAPDASAAEWENNGHRARVVMTFSKKQFAYMCPSSTTSATTRPGVLASLVVFDYQSPRAVHVW